MTPVAATAAVIMEVKETILNVWTLVEVEIVRCEGVKWLIVMRDLRGGRLSPSLYSPQAGGFRHGDRSRQSWSCSQGCWKMLWYGRLSACS
jgi:hypothetical protein